MAVNRTISISLADDAYLDVWKLSPSRMLQRAIAFHRKFGEFNPLQEG